MEQKYVVCRYADDWYEDHVGKVFDTYERAREYIVEHCGEDSTLCRQIDFIHNNKKIALAYFDDTIANEKKIKDTILKEEERFKLTLDKGYKLHDSKRNQCCAKGL